MSCGSFRLIAMIGEDGLEMSSITPLVCLGQNGSLNTYYLGRSGLLKISSTSFSDCPGFCSGGAGGSGASVSMQSFTPIIGPRGGVFVNTLTREIWNSNASSTNSTGSECECRIGTQYSQKVEDLEELKWVENLKFPGGMEATFPKGNNKLTCTKRYATTNSCGGSGGYTYPGPEPQDDCLSDASQTFFSCGLCNEGPNDSAVINESENCGNFSYQYSCRQSPAQALDKGTLFALAEESTRKRLGYLAGLPDEVPNQEGTALVLNPDKWSGITSGCSGAIGFYHKETPRHYGAIKTVLSLRIIDENLYSEDVELRNKALRNNASGEVIFVDTSTGNTTSIMPFQLSGGKADLEEISNSDAPFNPSEPEDQKIFSISIIVTNPSCEECD